MSGTTEVAQVRRFNRLVTQRVGALEDHYLARDRPLGEARVLWEIGGHGQDGDAGEHGCDVRSLRSRLDIDSGYLSRLLRSLEAAGLVEVGPNAGDRRVRTARLTPAGVAERAVLDRRSDDLARSFLEPLGEAQRTRLVAAMADVERLLTAAMVEIEALDPSQPAAQRCLNAYFAELDHRFDGGFDPALSSAPDLDAMRPPAGLFLVATLRGEPVGCGGLQFPRGAPPIIKRMWVDESARGLGIGRRLLAELEARARANGGRRVRLDTNRSLREAIGLYRSAGYREVEAFSDERYAHHWFEKRLS
jgi:DNA-binding MarR family transcriptional regulator/ribosomal protein S18 acetylase RimI-like enzyme